MEVILKPRSQNIRLDLLCLLNPMHLAGSRALVWGSHVTEPGFPHGRPEDNCSEGPCSLLVYREQKCCLTTEVWGGEVQVVSVNLL